MIKEPFFLTFIGVFVAFLLILFFIGFVVLFVLTTVAVINSNMWVGYKLFCVFLLITWWFRGGN